MGVVGAWCIRASIAIPERQRGKLTQVIAGEGQSASHSTFG